MKLINIFFLFVFIFFNVIVSGEKELIPLSVHVSWELWQKIGSHMGKERHRLIPEVIKFFNYDSTTAVIDKESFENNLRIYREPYLEELGKKLAAVNLKNSVFDKGEKPSLPKFKIFNQITNRYEVLKPYIINFVETSYENFITENYEDFFLIYTKIENLNESIINKNNLHITADKKSETIKDQTFDIEIFEEKDKKSKTIKISDLILHKNKNEDTFSFINGIVEKYHNTKRIIIDIMGQILKTPQIIYDNWKYKKITLQTIDAPLQILNDYTGTIFQRGCEGDTLLHQFVINNNKEGINILRQVGCDPNTQNNQQETALYLACKKGYVEVIKELLKFKNIDIETGKDGFSFIENILMKYPRFPHREKTIKLLLEYGINPNAASSKLKKTYICDSLLHQACEQSDLDIINLLIQYKANINIKNQDFQTPLHISVIYHRKNDNNLKAIKLLLEHKANQNIQDKDGNTPLHIACTKENYEIMQLLILYGANINIKNENGISPLDNIATKQTRKKIENLLLGETIKNELFPYIPELSSISNPVLLPLTAQEKSRWIPVKPSLPSGKPLRTELMAPWYRKYRKHLMAAITILFGSLGIFGILQYLPYKKNASRITK